MASRYRSRRSTRRLAYKSRRNFIITLLLVGILIYATINWILPSLINSIGFINSIIKPSKKVTTLMTVSLAPPVLNIPYEATNTAQINISGFATPLSKVKIYLDDEPKHEAEASSDGSFSVENVSLVLGTNNIFGKTSDERGESLPSKLIKVIYDNEKPFLEISEPEDGKEIQGGDKKVKVAGKAEHQAQIFVNEIRVVVSSEGNFSMDYPLNEGDNLINIKALDQASNETETVRKVIFHQ